MLASASQADGHVKKPVEHVAMCTRVLLGEHPGRLALQHMLASAYQADGQVKKAGTHRRAGHKGA